MSIELLAFYTMDELYERVWGKESFSDTHTVWLHGKWGRFPFFKPVDLDTMTDDDILRIVDEMPLEEASNLGVNLNRQQ